MKNLTIPIEQITGVKFESFRKRYAKSQTETQAVTFALDLLIAARQNDPVYGVNQELVDYVITTRGYDPDWAKQVLQDLLITGLISICPADTGEVIYTNLAMRSAALHYDRLSQQKDRCSAKVAPPTPTAEDIEQAAKERKEQYCLRTAKAREAKARKKQNPSLPPKESPNEPTAEDIEQARKARKEQNRKQTAKAREALTQKQNHPLPPKESVQDKVDADQGQRYQQSIHEMIASSVRYAVVPVDPLDELPF